MCGIAGFVDASSSVTADEWPAILDRMGNALAHRGPDDSGVWLDRDTGVGLSHRRLSILDRSPAGHQPMASASGRYVLAFNGEIYNHLDLRDQLGDLAWRGHSDTETLVAGFEKWGIEDTLRLSVGMFAMAVWDRNIRTLTLARDRMGEKPLYYGKQGATFLFGSELKALRQHPAFEGVIDRGALASYLRYFAVPTPRSIYRGIHKLRPGSLLRLALGNLEWGEPTPFWSLRDIAEGGQREVFQGSDVEAVTVLESKLLDAIRLQQIADVPLGMFLSGGIDSSVIAALMQAESRRPIRTFTVGFHEAGYNEADHAKAVACHLGTDHTELYVTPAQAQSVIQRLPTLYDEPFADSSQISTFLVSEMTRRHVTVSLSGDAGDELFGGYNRYVWAAKILGCPRPLRAVLARGLTTLSPSVWNRVHRALVPIMPASLAFSSAGDKAHKLASVMGAEDQSDIYLRTVSIWSSPTDVVLGAEEPPTLLDDSGAWPDVAPFEHQMMALDAMTYLPDDILVKVDRAAMGVSLETRVPFLDHRVVEFSWRLPLSMKIRDGQTKWPLRQILSKYVPKELTERPKAGFGVPIDTWLRGPLRDWAEALLDVSRLRQEGFFDPAPIRQKWAEHLDGQRNWAHQLWCVLMFQAWLEANDLA
jgi:asparagine synthase (glutamine-hydrolysing)